MGLVWSRLKGKPLVFLLIAVGLMLVAGLLQNYPAVVLGRVLDLIIEEDETTFRLVIPSLLLIAALFAGRELLTIVRKYLVEYTATKLERGEYVGVVRHLLSVNISQVLAQKVGVLSTRIDRSIEGLVKLIKLMFIEFLPTLITALIALSIAATRQWLVAAVMLVVTALGALLTFIQVRSQAGIRVELIRSKEDQAHKLTELLWGLDYVRASGLTEREVLAAGKLAEFRRAKEFKHHKWMMSFDSGKQLIEAAGYVIVLAIGAWLAARGSISEGDVLTLTVLYASVAQPLRELHRITDEAAESTLRVADLAGIYEYKLDSGLKGTHAPIGNTDSGVMILAKNLSVKFCADDASQVNALNGISAEVGAGQVIGLAGPSGSGKSTFIRTLLGLHPEYEGMLRVNDVEVRDADKGSLADLIGYVPQQPFLLSATFRENLQYFGKSNEFSDEKLWHALSEACLSDLVSSLAGGLDHEIREQGRDLSGGERQRLALARLFLRPAPLIVLDEATSALDSNNEMLILDNVCNTLRGSTIIIIAHRLMTLQRCDKILVFENGSIVQFGTFETLKAGAGLFSRLLELSRRATGVAASDSTTIRSQGEKL